jgi:hypothetical protein
MTIGSGGGSGGDIAAGLGLGGLGVLSLLGAGANKPPPPPPAPPAPPSTSSTNIEDAAAEERQRLASAEGGGQEGTDVTGGQGAKAPSTTKSLLGG